MMSRLSMARVSSASTEADYVPATVPFNWEAAPGRPARQSKSGFNGNAGREVEEASLPLPPGRRPKDGFYLPYSKPDVQSATNLQNAVLEPGGSSSPRKFSLKLPGTYKKPLFTGRNRQPFENSSKPSARIREDVGDDDSTHGAGNHPVSIFHPVSGHRYGSRMARKVLVELLKKRSCFKRCLEPSKPGSEEREIDSRESFHHRGRRLDSIVDSNEELHEVYVTATHSTASRPSLPSSPGHGGDPERHRHRHRHARNSSTLIAGKQPQQPSSRFMASMLMSLCASDSYETDEPDADAVAGIADDDSDETSISHLTLPPRAGSYSPEAIFGSPQKVSEALEVMVDPASPKLPSLVEFAKLDMSTPQIHRRKNMSRNINLHTEPAIAGPSEHRRSGELVQPKSFRTREFANQSNQNTVADKHVADEHSLFSKASSDRGMQSSSWRPWNSSISRESHKKSSRKNEQLLADFVKSNIVQEPGDFEIGKERFENAGDEFERQGSTSSLARNFSTGSDSGSSSSSEAETRFSLHKFVWPPTSLTANSTGKDAIPAVSLSRSAAGDDMVGYLSPPRCTSEDAELYPSTTTKVPQTSDKPKAFARWRSTSSTRTTTSAGSSSLLSRRSSLGNNRPPVARTNSNSREHLLQRQQPSQSTTPATEIRIIKDHNKVASPSSTSSAWLQALKASSLWRPNPSRSSQAAGNGDLDDDEGYISSTTSEYETPKAISSRSPSLSSPVYNIPAQKPTTWLVSEKLLRSSPLLKSKLQRQQNHESPRSSSFMVEVDSSTTLQRPSFEQIMARSHSVRSAASRVLTTTRHEHDAISTDHNSLKAETQPLAPGRLSNTSSNSSSVRSRVVEWETKAESSSGKPLPTRRSMSSRAPPSPGQRSWRWTKRRMKR